VDPIKFYEYRALSLPVISTAFGEMKLRGSEPGTFSVRPGDPLAKTVAQALALLPQDQEREIFINRNSWQVRFDAIKELVQVPPA
jgi:hypothetical protein